jgi:hypothetical protein
MHQSAHSSGVRLVRMRHRVPSMHLIICWPGCSQSSGSGFKSGRRNLNYRTAIGFFDPSQNAQFRRTPQSSWNYKQQSHRRCAANGFAFRPPYVPFSWTAVVWAVETGAVKRAEKLHLHPYLPLKKEGRPSPTREHTTQQELSPLCTELSSSKRFTL